MNYIPVFELVKSLNSSEKKYFKIYSSRHIIDGANKYLLLFDILESMKNYEEDSLSYQLKEKGKDISYLKADMNYLYHNILKSLLFLHAGKSAQLIVHESHSKIEILYHKALYRTCLREINKAIALAESTELFGDAYKLLHIEKRVRQHLTSSPVNKLSITERIGSILEKKQQLLHYDILYETINDIRLRLSKTRAESELNQLKILMQQDIIKDIKHATSITSTIRFYQIHAMYHYVQRNRKEELHCNEQIIELFNNNLLYKEEYLADYVNTQSRIISITKELPEVVFFKALKEIREIPIPPERLYYKGITAQVFNFSYMIELSHYLQKKQFKKATTIIPLIENGLEKYTAILTASHKLTFLYMLGYFYFATGEFIKARDYIHALLETYQEKDRPDLYHFAQLLHLLIHFELKNYALIKYKCASVRYFFKKEAAHYKAENLLLAFLQKEKNYTRDVYKNLHALQKALLSIKEDALEKYAFVYIDFSDWVDSKIAKKASISMLYDN